VASNLGRLAAGSNSGAYVSCRMLYFGNFAILRLWFGVLGGVLIQFVFFMCCPMFVDGVVTNSSYILI
jgi:hypothetical protein